MAKQSYLQHLVRHIKNKDAHILGIENPLADPVLQRPVRTNDDLLIHARIPDMPTSSQSGVETNKRFFSYTQMNMHLPDHAGDGAEADWTVAVLQAHMLR